MKSFIKITLVVLIVISLVTFGGYQYFHSPHYTLKKISSSVKNCDWEMFSKYVDVEALVNSLIQNAGDDSGNDLAKGITAMVGGSMKETLIAQMKSQIENPKNDESQGIFSEFGRLDSIGFKMKQENKGKILVVKLISTFGVFNVPAFIEITMRSEGLKYVVIAINKDVVKKRTETVMNLYKEYYYVPIREKIAKSVQITVQKKFKGCANSFYGTCFEDLIMIQRKIENLTDRRINQVQYEMYPSDFFISDEYKYIDIFEGINPKESVIIGASQGWKYNQFIESDKVWMNVESSDILLRVTRVTFEDGESLTIDNYSYLGHLDSAPKLVNLVVFGKKENYPEADSIALWMK